MAMLIANCMLFKSASLNLAGLLVADSLDEMFLQAVFDGDDELFEFLFEAGDEQAD